MTKPRVIKDYEKLDASVLDLLRKTYPMGYEKHLIKFQNREGKWVSALPFETPEKCYLIRMTLIEAKGIDADDRNDEDDAETFDAIMASADSKADFDMEMEEE